MTTTMAHYEFQPVTPFTVRPRTETTPSVAKSVPDTSRKQCICRDPQCEVLLHRVFEVTDPNHVWRKGGGLTEMFRSLLTMRIVDCCVSSIPSSLLPPLVSFLVLLVPLGLVAVAFTYLRLMSSLQQSPFLLASPILSRYLRQKIIRDAQTTKED